MGENEDGDDRLLKFSEEDPPFIRLKTAGGIEGIE